MFSNPNWIWLEVLVIVLVIGFFVALISVYAYKKVHHIPTGECTSCHSKSKKMLKEYHKMYGKKA